MVNIYAHTDCNYLLIFTRSFMNKKALIFLSLSAVANTTYSVETAVFSKKSAICHTVGSVLLVSTLGLARALFKEQTKVKPEYPVYGSFLDKASHVVDNEIIGQPGKNSTLQIAEDSKNIVVTEKRPSFGLIGKTYANKKKIKEVIALPLVAGFTYATMYTSVDKIARLMGYSNPLDIQETKVVVAAQKI